MEHGRVREEALWLVFFHKGSCEHSPGLCTIGSRLVICQLTTEVDGDAHEFRSFHHGRHDVFRASNTFIELPPSQFRRPALRRACGRHFGCLLRHFEDRANPMSEELLSPIGSSEIEKTYFEKVRLSNGNLRMAEFVALE